jgi:hypothetical protein
MKRLDVYKAFESRVTKNAGKSDIFAGVLATEARAALILRFGVTPKGNKAEVLETLRNVWATNPLARLSTQEELLSLVRVEGEHAGGEEEEEEEEENVMNE